MKNSVIILFALLFSGVNFTFSANTCYQCDSTKPTSLDKMCETPVEKKCMKPRDSWDEVLCVKGTPKKGTNATIYSCANKDEAKDFVSSCRASNTTCDKLICDNELCNHPTPLTPNQFDSIRVVCYVCTLSNDWPYPCSKPDVKLCEISNMCGIGLRSKYGEQTFGCILEKGYDVCNAVDECYMCNTSFCNRGKGGEFDTALGKETTVSVSLSSHKYDKKDNNEKRNGNSDAMAPKNNKMLLLGLVIFICLQVIL